MAEKLVQEPRRIGIEMFFFHEQAGHASAAVDRVPERKVTVRIQAPVSLAIRNQRQQSGVGGNGAKQLAIGHEIAVEGPRLVEDHTGVRHRHGKRDGQPRPLGWHRARRGGGDREQHGREQPPNVDEARAIDAVGKDEIEHDERGGRQQHRVPPECAPVDDKERDQRCDVPARHHRHLRLRERIERSREVRHLRSQRAKPRRHRRWCFVPQ